MPKLLKTQSGKWLEYGEECYFLVGDFTNKGLPSWVRVPSLDAEYQELHFNHAETSEEIKKVRENDKVTHISRLISQRNIYPLIKFAYRDRSNIISTVNSSVDNYNKSIDFVNWLWSNYQEESEDWTPLGRSDNSLFNYKFPSAALDCHASFIDSDRRCNRISSSQYVNCPCRRNCCHTFLNCPKWICLCAVSAN